MKRKTILTLIIAGILVGSMPIGSNGVNASNNICTSSEMSGLETSFNQKIESITSDKSTRIASMQYAVSEGDNIILSGSSGYSDRDKSIKADNNSMYGVGSISKLYTATAVMQLVEKGLVDLDMPVTTYIPDFKMKDEEYKKITVRMLLNHTAGIQGTTQRNVILREINDTNGYDQFLKDLSEQGLKAHPGENPSYSNDGFTLAQLLVERVSGKDFTTYIRENISKPLGLKSTKTPRDEFNRIKMAKAYDWYLQKEEPLENFMDIGMGGVYSTSEEVCKFVNAITHEDKNILSKKSIEAMAHKECLKGVWPTDADDNFIAFGLGWDSVNLFPFSKYGLKAFCKVGVTFDYVSFVVTIPEYNLTVTSMASGDNAEYVQIVAISSMLDVLKSKGIIKELPKTKLNFERSQYMPKYLKDFSGVYMSRDGYYNVDIKDDGTLEYTIDGNNKVTLYHTYSGYFQSEDGLRGIRFVKEKNGETYMEEKTYIHGDGLYEFANCGYNAQKIENNPLSDEVKKAWDKRSNKNYLVVSENYVSQFYQYTPMLFINDEMNGYINGYGKIIDENNSKAALKLTGVASTDIYDYEFVEKDGVEYINTGGIVYMSQDGVKELKRDMNNITISKDGNTKWFTVPEELNGKKISVRLPKKSNLIIMKPDGKTKENFYFYNAKQAVLETGDYIAAVGEADADIKISIWN